MKVVIALIAVAVGLFVGLLYVLGSAVKHNRKWD